MLGKGVVTGILPDNQMPQREIDGKHLDIILSPNSVIGRLNLGQIFETTINRISEEVYKDLLSKDNEKDFKELYIEFMKDLLPERLHNQLSPIEKMRSGKPLKEFIQSIKDDGYLRIPQVPFETISMDLLSKWYNKYNMNNDTLLLNGKKIINPILTGNQYFLKLKHLPEKKVSACNSKKFGSKSLQPTKDNSYRMYKAPIGASPNTVGEQETALLMALSNNVDILKELVFLKSSDIKNRKLMLEKLFSMNEISLDDFKDKQSIAIRNLNYYLNVIGLTLDK